MPTSAPKPATKAWATPAPLRQQVSRPPPPPAQPPPDQRHLPLLAQWGACHMLRQQGPPRPQEEVQKGGKIE